jgi:hypothetical protein
VPIQPLPLGRLGEGIAQQGSKWGIFNEVSKQWEVACEYDTIQNIGYSYPGFYIGTKNGQKTLFGQDKNGKLGALTEEFQSIELIFMNQDIWKVKKADKYGLIQLNTQKTTGFVYDMIYLPIFPSKFCMVKNQGKIGVMDEQFQIKIPISLGLDSISQVFWGWDSNKLVSRKNGKWGVVDTLGNILLPFKYAEAPFYVNTRYWIFRENKKISILDNKTNRLVLNNLDLLQDTDTQNKFFVCKQKSQYLLLDSTFQQIGAAYSGMQKAEFGLVRQNVDYFIVQKNQKYGVMASTGKLVIPLVYDKLEAGGNQFFIARKADKVGILDTTNQRIVDFEYAQIYRLTNEFFIGEKEGKIQVLPLTKEPLQPLIAKKSTSIHWYASTLYFQDKNGKWGWLNPYSLEIITPQYDSLVLNSGVPYSYYSEKAEKIYLAARKNGKWGLIDEAQRVILPFEYEQILVSLVSLNAIAVQKAGKVALVNLDGQLLTNFEAFAPEIGVYGDSQTTLCYQKKGIAPNAEGKGKECWRKTDDYTDIWVKD